MSEVTFLEAIQSALRDEMRADDRGQSRCCLYPRTRLRTTCSRTAPPDHSIRTRARSPLGSVVTATRSINSRAI